MEALDQGLRALDGGCPDLAEFVAIYHGMHRVHLF